MTGVLFIIVVPTAEHELALRKDKNDAELIQITEHNTGLDSRAPYLLSKTDFPSITGSLHKCSTDGILSDMEKSSLGADNKSYLKSSWEELKQHLKPWRNKLRITSPHREADILAAFHADTPLETIVTEVLKRLEIKNATWSLTNNGKFNQVMFSIQSSGVSEEALHVLRALGVGARRRSALSVLPCALSYGAGRDGAEDDGGLLDANTAWSRFTSSVRARTNLAQVLHAVRADGALTFDWLFLLVVAAFVAALGLVENSTVILVASMLLSPLMGPITAATLGTAVRNRSLQRLGLQNELFGLFLSLVIGFIFGLVICAVDERYGVGDWPTSEMMMRCEVRSLWIGVLVAVPSGAAVALAVLGDYTGSLVGVAISASLLPPAVNAGLLWAMSVVHLISHDAGRWRGAASGAGAPGAYSGDPAAELAVLGGLSLCLTLVNILCIFLAGVAVYKVKEVSPLERRDISWWVQNKGLMSQPEGRKGGAWRHFTNGVSTNWPNNLEDIKKFSDDGAESVRRRAPPPPPPGPFHRQTLSAEHPKPTATESEAELARAGSRSRHAEDIAADSLEAGSMSRATLEPSTCWTVDPSLNGGLCLASRSYDV